jgi:hypothetical protein
MQIPAIQAEQEAATINQEEKISKYCLSEQSIDRTFALNQ